MPRLIREVVEKSISEMYDALSSIPDDEGHEKSYQQAREIEAKLHKQLQAQEFMDLRSQDMCMLLKKLTWVETDNKAVLEIQKDARRILATVADEDLDWKKE